MYSRGWTYDPELGDPVLHQYSMTNVKEKQDQNQYVTYKSEVEIINRKSTNLQLSCVYTSCSHDLTSAKTRHCLNVCRIRDCE